MGKVIPPPEIFSEWSPEAQRAYNIPLDSLAKQRDNCYAEAARLDESAANYRHDAEMYQMVIDKDLGKNASDSAKLDGTLLHVYKSDYLADKDCEAAAAQREEAARLDKELSELQITPTHQSSVDHESIKADYVEETKKAMQDDWAKHDELQKQIKAKREELDSRWIFKTDLIHELTELNAQDVQLMENLTYNGRNLENTVPKAPLPPPSATPIGRSFVASGAKMICPFAMGGQSALVVTPSRKAFVEGPQMANIMDHKSLVNIPSFGMCMTLSNPQVAAATSAALGVLTPQPCIPNTIAPWAPGKPDLLVDGSPALLNTDTLQCLWGGVITILP